MLFLREYRCGCWLPPRRQSTLRHARLTLAYVDTSTHAFSDPAFFLLHYRTPGFTMLYNAPMFAVIARIYEQVMAPLATGHLCVTEAMKTFIEREFKIPTNKINVLHDCPNAMFRPQNAQNNHELLTRLHGKLCAGCPRSWYQHLDPEKQTLFTEQKENGEYCPRSQRPALVTSSTSWTPDEDFGLLLAALVGLDKQILEEESSLKIVVAITGKGPNKTFFEKEISSLRLQNIAIETLWLEHSDYPRLLACADVGISLHTSTSGIDLPMKVLDLFGCEVPVCARQFRCLPELVQDDVQGRVFETSQELQEQLSTLLSPLARYPGCWPPHGFADLARYSRALHGRKRWDSNWKENALPVLQSAINSQGP
jgi:beta-1,4-mannosyltransferase